MRSIYVVFALLIHWPTSPLTAQSCDDPFEDVGSIDFSTRGWETDFCIRSVPLSEFRSGGPPRDGIPPIDEPRFVSVDEADDWIEAREPVIAVNLGDEARAYPLQILTWHEIVNDEIDGTPIAVTFCPLCYAAIVFQRPSHDGDELTFGTTGNLRNSDLVMWDRQTESWWQQFSGRAVVGELTGQVLETIPSPIVSWDEFRERFPEARVLSRETGYDRRYGENPYVGYDDASQPPWLFDGDVGSALRPMERVVGIENEATARAYRLSTVREVGVINDEMGGESIVLFWTRKTASALDSPKIADGKRVGSAAAYRSRLGDRELVFSKEGDAFVDAQTESTWNVFGEATGGPLRGAKLDPLQVHHTFWFVWSAFKGPEALGTFVNLNDR